MKEEFSKYDKVVYDGEVFEVLETADNTGIMKIEPLFDETYKFIWVDEEMVVSLSRAIKLRLIDDETADEAMNFGKPKIGDAVVESGPLVGKDGSGKDDRADGKLRWDLLPLAEIEDIVRVYTEGAKKYADNSWQNIPDGFERSSAYYQVFLTDSKEVIQNMMHGIIYGKWTFVKRGENFGIKLVKVLPKIHKISLDMIAKDIFRSENK